MTAAAWLLSGLGSLVFIVALATTRDPEPLSADPEETRRLATIIAKLRLAMIREQRKELYSDRNCFEAHSRIRRWRMEGGAQKAS